MTGGRPDDHSYADHDTLLKQVQHLQSNSRLPSSLSKQSQSGDPLALNDVSMDQGHPFDSRLEDYDSSDEGGLRVVCER